MGERFEWTDLDRSMLAAFKIQVPSIRLGAVDYGWLVERLTAAVAELQQRPASTPDRVEERIVRQETAHELHTVRDALSVLADKLSASCEDQYELACRAAFSACDRIEARIRALETALEELRAPTTVVKRAGPIKLPVTVCERHRFGRGFVDFSVEAADGSVIGDYSDQAVAEQIAAALNAQLRSGAKS